MASSANEIEIDKRAIRASLNNLIKSAEVVDLVYISGNTPGLTRKVTKNGFAYFDGKKKITDKNELERIKKLGIPPAWKDVWICKISNGHLQATGIDALNRKQYRYHTSWNQIRKRTKFYRLLMFGKQIGLIRAKVDDHLAQKGYTQEKILAAVVSLLDITNIRVGNSIYEKLYGSFGLTTMKNHHVKISGTQIRFTFKGKKGISHDISLKSKKLARIVKECKEMPGKELFEFYDENGNIHCIDSGMVNSYIRNISEGEFTAKDFRTWAGTLNAIKAFKELGEYESTSEMNKKVATAFEMVAKQLGNTKNVCKNHYVHPLIVDLYKENKLKRYLSGVKNSESNVILNQLNLEEKILLRILEKN